MAEPSLPGVQSFASVLERTIQLVGSNVPRSDLQKVAEVLKSLRWEFRDYGIHVYFLLNHEGKVRCAKDWSGPVDSIVSMDAATLHSVAFGHLNLGVAMLLGKLRIEGISASNLGRFSFLLQPFLDSYRQACAELHDPAR